MRGSTNAKTQLHAPTHGLLMRARQWVRAWTRMQVRARANGVQARVN